MEAKRFDRITRSLTTETSRRQVVGRLLGATAAVLGGATLLSSATEAKKGTTHPKPKPTPKPKPKPGSAVCRRDKKHGTFTLSHKHPKAEDVVCSLGPCQVATGCEVTGDCITAQAGTGAKCTTTAGTKGTCDAAGTCIATPTPKQKPKPKPKPKS